MNARTKGFVAAWGCFLLIPLGFYVMLETRNIVSYPSSILWVLLAPGIIPLGASMGCFASEKRQLAQGWLAGFVSGVVLSILGVIYLLRNLCVVC